MEKKLIPVLMLASLLLFTIPCSVSATPPVGQWWKKVAFVSPGGYMNLKGVYAACNRTHLFLLAEFYDSIPNEKICEYEVYFFLDIDRNHGTGGTWWSIVGAEFFVEVWSSGNGSKGGRLDVWDSSTSRWKDLTDPVEALFEVGGDYVGGAVSLDVLGMGVGDTFDLGIRIFDLDPLTTNPFTYTVGEASAHITIDGFGDDWTDAVKKVSDPAGDCPGVFDFTAFYVTDWSNSLFFRFDFVSLPTGGTLPENKYLLYYLDLYIDADQNPATGSKYGYYGEWLNGIGAEYHVEFQDLRLPTQKFIIPVPWRWTGTSWEDVSDAYIWWVKWENVTEIRIELPAPGIFGSGSVVRMYLARVGGEFAEYGVPGGALASYTITVDETAPSISDVSYSPETPISDQATTVTANVTDVQSGVKRAEIMYSTDGGATWASSPMTGGSTYTGTIPKQAGETTVSFKVKAEDYMDNTAESTTYTYKVKTTIFGLEPVIFYALVGVAIIAAAVVILLFVRRKTPAAPSPTTPPPAIPT